MGVFNIAMGSLPPVQSPRQVGQLLPFVCTDGVFRGVKSVASTTPDPGRSRSLS